MTELTQPIQAITVSVNDLNDNAPVFADVNYDITIVENTKGPTLLETTDADADSTVTYSLSGADAADFEIVNNTLALKEAADFETKTSYAVTVTANDGVNSTTQAVTYTITDENDNRPIITSQNVFTVDENQLSVGTVTITDADGGSNDPDWIAFFIDNGVDKDLFEIGFKTGVITFKSAPDYETKSEYNFQVNVSDGTLPETTQQVKVVIKDVDEAPVFNQTGQIGLNEGTINVGQISASDPEGEDLTFKLTGSNDIEISETGYLKFITAPDFETKSEYTATIIATDPAGNATELDTVLTIRDVNEAPVFTSGTAFTFDENATSAITTITTTDEDTDSVVTYQITGGTDGARFAVNSTTGVLTFSGFIPDFENPLFSNDNDYEVTVTASDGTNTTDQTITVSVNDLNDNAPVFTSNAAVTIDENTTDVVTLVTTDDDADSTVSYSITGGADATSFAVNQASGALTFKDKPDFESPADANTDNIYNVTVTATDNDGFNKTTQDITVTIDNINDERPIITSPTQFVFEVPENFPLGTKIPGTDIIGYDPDGNAIIACSFAVYNGLGIRKGVSVAGNYLEDGSCHLVFGSEAVIDYESDVKQYKGHVAIYEEGYLGQSNPFIFTINITDVNEAPTITSTTTAFTMR